METREGEKAKNEKAGGESGVEEALGLIPLIVGVGFDVPVIITSGRHYLRPSLSPTAIALMMNLPWRARRL